MATVGTILARLISLEKKDQTKTEQIAALQEIDQTKTEQIAALQETDQIKTEQIAALQETDQIKTAQIVALQETDQTKTKQIDALEQRVELNKKGNNDKKKTIGSMQNKLSVMESKMIHLEEEEIPKLNLENDKLAKENIELRTKSNTMESMQNKLSEMESKMTHMEKEEIPKLKLENDKLAKENTELRAQQSSMESNTRDRLDSMERDVKQMRENIDRLETIEIPRLKTEYEMLSLNKERLERKLNSDVSATQVTVSKLQENISETLATVSNLQETIRDVQKIEEDVRNMNGIRRVLNRSLVETHEVLEKKKKTVSRSCDHRAIYEDQLVARTEAIEARFDHIQQSVTCVRLQPCSDLVTGRPIELNVCTHVHTNNGYFDPHSGCLDPKEDGVYAVNIWFQQRGAGEIEVFRQDDVQTLEENRFSIGKTSYEDDISCSMFLFKLKQGEQFLLEALRLKGNATVHRCVLFSWRIY